jgi:hypothetical protein
MRRNLPPAAAYKIWLGGRGLRRSGRGVGVVSGPGPWRWVTDSGPDLESGLRHMKRRRRSPEQITCRLCASVVDALGEGNDGRGDEGRGDTPSG